MFTFVSLRCSGVSRLWTKKLQFEKTCCRDVKEVISAILVYTRVWSNYTPLKNQIYTCFWEPGRIVLQRSFLYQSWKKVKVPCLSFQHFSGLSKAVETQRRRNNVRNTERNWKDSESRAKRSGVTEGEKDLCVRSKSDPWLSAPASHPAFFQG